MLTTPNKTQTAAHQVFVALCGHRHRAMHDPRAAARFKAQTITRLAAELRRAFRKGAKP